MRNVTILVIRRITLLFFIRLNEHYIISCVKGWQDESKLISLINLALIVFAKVLISGQKDKNLDLRNKNGGEK